MEHRQRRLVAAVVLIVSLVVGTYLVFFSPSETQIALSTPTTTIGAPAEAGSPNSTVPKSLARQMLGAFAIYTTLLLDPEANVADEAEANDAPRAMAPMPDWMSRIASTPAHDSCPETATREVAVSSSDELETALDSAKPGDQISLAAGTYDGNFVLNASGEPYKRIWICGPRSAVIDSGGLKEGYALQITGNYAGVWGITVSNAQKGIVIDGGDFVQNDNIEVRSIGDEAIHFRGGATDGVVQDSRIHHTGLRREKFGEGIYVGSAVSNWPK